jgi:hypothetical protein
MSRTEQARKYSIEHMTITVKIMVYETKMNC